MWTIPVQMNKPKMQVKLDGIIFKGVVDIGTAITLLRVEKFDNLECRTEQGPNVQGIGVLQPPPKLKHLTVWEDTDGSKGSITPLAVEGLHNNLSGRIYWKVWMQ